MANPRPFPAYSIVSQGNGWFGWCAWRSWWDLLALDVEFGPFRVVSDVGPPAARGLAPSEAEAVAHAEAAAGSVGGAPRRLRPDFARRFIPSGVRPRPRRRLVPRGVPHGLHRPRRRFAPPPLPEFAVTLGLARWPVSREEVHRAYRRRALDLHPDVRRDDGAAFLELQAAEARALEALGVE